MKLNQRLIAIILIEIIFIVGIVYNMRNEIRHYRQTMWNLELMTRDVILHDAGKRMYGDQIVRALHNHLIHLMMFEAVLVVCFCALIITGLKFLPSSRQ